MGPSVRASECGISYGELAQICSAKDINQI